VLLTLRIKDLKSNAGDAVTLADGAFLEVVLSWWVSEQ
jgi:hypothetical protein